MNSNMKDGKLLSACGLYCGACTHYRAGYPDGEHLIEKWLRKGMKPRDFPCGGCRSDKLYIHPGCLKCDIRSCADMKMIIHCGECSEFPCQRLEEFRDDGRPHHRDVVDNCLEINRIGPENWLKDQSERWRCTCGKSYSWYEKTCPKCGKGLDSYDRK